MKYDQQLRRRWLKPQTYTDKTVKNAMVVSLGDQCVVLATVADKTKLLLYDLADGRLIREDEIKELGDSVVIQDALAYSHNRILVGGTLSEGQGTKKNLVLMVVDLAGEIVQTFDYEMSGDETLSQMQRTRDGGFVLVGNMTRSQLVDLFVMKVKGDDLAQQWFHHYDARIPLPSLAIKDLNAGQWITQGHDGSYYVAGTAAYFNGRFQAICMKLDVNGNMVWRTPFTGRDQSDIVSRFVSVLDDDHIMLVAEKRMPENVTRLCFAQLNGKGEQVEMVEQVKLGETCGWAAATSTQDNGLLYVKNSFMEKQDRLVVETEKINDVSEFFSTEKDKSERALKALKWTSSPSK